MEVVDSLVSFNDVFVLGALGIVGFFIGFVGGLVGLVLGVLRLPLVYFVEVSPQLAAGTNIGISTMGALGGSYKHIREHRVDTRLFLSMGVSSFVGAFLGGNVSTIVPSFLLLGLVAVILLYYGVTMSWRRKESDRPEVRANVSTAERSLGLEALIGFVIGFLGGMVGLLLGSLRLPAMIRRLKIDPKTAVGTNLTIGLFTGIFGLLGHLLHGNLDFLLLVTMGVAAILGSYLGAEYTGKVDQEKLKGWIGYVLLAVSLAMFGQAYLSLI